MKISVIVPVYNVEMYLKRCVDSILAQTAEDFELILVDDGSTDSGGVICDEYRKADGRVKVIHQENGGLSRARNAGIDAAAGEYLRFVDSDDCVAPYFLSTLLSMCEENGADMAVCGYELINGTQSLDQVPVTLMLHPTEVIDKRNFFLRLNTKQEIVYVAAWNKLYRRSLFDGIRYPRGRINEDEAVIHLIADRCERIAVTGQPMYFYCMREGSITHRQDFSRQKMDIFPFLQDRMEYFEDRGWDDLRFMTSQRYMLACLEMRSAIPEDFPDGKMYKNHLMRMFKNMLSRAKKNKAASKKFLLKMAGYSINPGKYKAGSRQEILFGHR